MAGQSRETLTTPYDAIVIGSGPNGLTSAITLARQGWSVRVLEARETVGGGMRTAELTLPGFQHDICSAIHPLGVGSPFFRSLPLHDYGLEWVQPPYALAHPFDDGTAAALPASKQWSVNSEQWSVRATSEFLGHDAPAYQRLMAPLVADWEKIIYQFLGPLRPPRHPLAMARFGLRAIGSAKGLAERWFTGEKAQGFFAGMAAHAIMPLENLTTAAFGLMLTILGHAVGWPFPRGGSQKIADALAGYLQDLGGEIVTGHPVTNLDNLPPARAVLCDVTPRQLIQMAGHKLPPRYRRQLEKYRYGPGVFKVDFALSEPVPWKAAECRQAGTVHLGGTLAEIAASERAMFHGRHAERPYVLLAQQSLFDPARAPTDQHTLWAYCHVPNGSTEDMTERIEAQIERFAPGFRDCILARHTMTTQDYQRYNPNYIGGDINGGIQDIWQLFTRPVARLNPYTTPIKGLFLCSASTPPGGGVHGMCGYYAAQAAQFY